MRNSHLAAILLSSAALCACSTYKPPTISYDAIPRRAVLKPEPPKPVQIVEVPKLLPLPDQLKLIPPIQLQRPESPDPQTRVEAANKEARVEPTRAAYINAVQVFPFTDGALYQVYAAPGEITDLTLEAGEQLVGTGPVAAGDTVRWVIGNTESGSGSGKRIHILLKPTQTALATNLVINTDRRTYHLELRSMDRTYMASVSWSYPLDQLIAIKGQSVAAEREAPLASSIDLTALNFRYRLEGDAPAWRPVRAFDDGRQVFIAFPSGISQGEMPPLWIIGPQGEGQLVNYRVRGSYMIVDRLFAVAELRLGAAPQQTVRIVRTDGKPS